MNQRDADGSSTGFVLGYSTYSGLAFEIEKTSMEVDLLGITTMDIDTLAFYVASRFGDEVFFKVKGGFLTEDVSVPGIPSESDSGMSYGLGAGFQAEHFIAEIEYTLIEADVSLISVGVAYRF